MPAEATQAGSRVERSMARMEDVPWRVVDVHEDGVESPARRLRIKPGVGLGQCEEVALAQTGTRI